MSLFGKRTSDPYENGNLFEDIFEKLTEQEIEELELDDERREAYEEARRRARRRHRVRILLTVFLLFILTVVVAVVGYICLFNISEIEVVGDGPYTVQEICDAAGVAKGDGLYSFSSVTAEDRLVSSLPYIKSLDVDRHMPDKIIFTVEYEKPVYYTEIYGKIYLMSESLRVLGEAGDTDLSELVWLRLSGVKSARFGYTPVLRDKIAQQYLMDVIDSVNSSVLKERISQIDLRSIYELNIVCDDMYLLVMGEYDQVKTKLRIADAVLQKDDFKNGNKARLDLTKLSETVVIFNNKLDFTE
ncbi:MAG: FtsQ-type POTRA domain-containing protein [Clostridia bacterium]|nr:FtsQ-type POTRA domain-containing protein [Clostridia bacterium]